MRGCERGGGRWLRTSSKFGREAGYVGGHPSFQLDRRGTRQRIRRRLDLAGLVRDGKVGRLGRVERVLGVALVGLLRHAVAFHHGRYAQAWALRAEEGDKQDAVSCSVLNV